MATTSQSSSHSSTPRRSSKDRRFRPDELYAKHISLDLVEVNQSGVWTFTACPISDPCKSCGRLVHHTDSIIIAVDGACRGNGTPEARAAVGVFVARESRYNTSLAVPFDEVRATNQVAELSAGICGLRRALLIQSHKVGGEDLRQVIIKADSEYLVKGMTDWVFKWEKNGYTTAKGKPVTNARLFRELLSLVAELNELNVEVLFWHVPRAYNEEADALAGAALDESTAKRRR